MPMTVKDLIAQLETLPQDAIVVEERESECRTLEANDITSSTQICNADSGDVEEGEYVVLGAWS